MRKKLHFTFNIKMQLLIGFLVPILFVIGIGTISYRKAEEGMAANYEDSAKTAIDTQMEYLDFGLSLIHADAVQLKLDSELTSLAGGTYKNDSSKASSVYNKTVSSLKVKQTSNAFIKNIYIIPTSDNKIITTAQGSLAGQMGYLEKWAATEEGKRYFEGKDMTGWTGSHPQLDALSGYPAQDYIMSYIGVFSNRAAIIVVDISRQAVVDSLAGIETGNGEIIGFVTADGQELVVKGEDNPDEIRFMEQDFFRESMEAEALTDAKYVTWNNKEYFFLYSRSEKTGVGLCYLVPRESIVKGAASIREITQFLVIVACVAALILGALISVNISAGMAGMTKRLKRAAAGDLTVKMKTRGRDEFGILSQHMMEVLQNTRKLIREVEDIVALNVEAAGKVEAVSGQIEVSSGEIMTTLSEIDEGVSRQAEDAHDCLIQMDSLSQSIESIGGDIVQAKENSETAREIIRRSIGTMEILSQQSAATTEITTRVKEDVKKLEEKSALISGFVETIHSIAKQTNLLSLNASIEAARAGESGRGFAVVAEEIRSLAEGSREAAVKIQKVVEQINIQTAGTVKTAESAGSIVAQQADTVSQTKEDFNNIYHCTQKLITNTQKIAEQVTGMDEKRLGTLEAVSSISAVAEQTAASSSNVSRIAGGQKAVIASLQEASSQLKEKMNALEETLSAFKTHD